MPLTQLYGGGIYFAAEHVRPVLDAFRRLVASAPEALTASFAFLRLPDDPAVPKPLRERFSVHVRIAYLGPPADGERLVADLRATAPALVDTVAEMPFTAISSIHADPVDPVPSYETSTLLRDFPEEAADALIGAVGPGVDTPIVVVEIRQMGGALAHEPTVPNAVGHRDAAFQLFAGAFAEPGMEAEFRPPLTALTDAIRPWSTGGKQANFLTGYDTAVTEVAKAYEPDIYQRLTQIKREYDPTDMFRINHNIPPGL